MTKKNAFYKNIQRKITQVKCKICTLQDVDRTGVYYEKLIMGR